MSGIAGCDHQLKFLHHVNSQLACWIPSAQDDPTICRIFFDFADALSELINTLSGVIGIAGLVFSPIMPPLEAVDRPQISLASMAEPALL